MINIRRNSSLWPQPSSASPPPQDSTVLLHHRELTTLNPQRTAAPPCLRDANGLFGEWERGPSQCSLHSVNHFLMPLAPLGWPTQVSCLLLCLLKTRSSDCLCVQAALPLPKPHAREGSRRGCEEQVGGRPGLGFRPSGGQQEELEGETLGLHYPHPAPSSSEKVPLHSL